MPDTTIEFLKTLVAIDSVNPALVPGGAGEREIAVAVRDEMRGSGLDVVVEEIAPGRFNVVGVLDGRAPGRTLMLCGHLDTVGVSGMVAPFDPLIRDGRLYGRGSQDMKGGLAAMIAAARRIAETGGLAGGRLVLAAVADEEHGSLGAEALVPRWNAAAAIVTEPTDLSVAVAHKGFAWVDVVAEGRAAHGSRPLEGRDAILRMGRILGRLERLDRDLQARPPHPLLGAGSLHASLIEGGRELSSYPDRCSLIVERRTLPGEAPGSALDDVQAILAALMKEDAEFAATARLRSERSGYETPQGHELPPLLDAALGRAGRPASRTGMTYWTDAAVLGNAGIPSVVFGPGGAGLHSLEEHVRIDEVIACRDILADVARRYCAA